MPGSRPLARLFLSGKAAPDKATDLFSLMEEVLGPTAAWIRKSGSSAWCWRKNGQEHGLVPAGHMVVAARLRASLSGAGSLSESTGGISYLNLRSLSQRIDSDWPGVLRDLEILRRCVLHRAGAALNLTAIA